MRDYDTGRAVEVACIEVGLDQITRLELIKRDVVCSIDGRKDPADKTIIVKPLIEKKLGIYLAVLRALRM